jgi:hypothetical protein
MMRPEPIAVVKLYRDERGVYAVLVEVPGACPMLSPEWRTVLGALMCAGQHIINRLRARPAPQEDLPPAAWVT